MLKNSPKNAGVKTYVLDTNVLLHDGQSLESFHDNDVVIPLAVIEELDKFKKNSDELGRNARTAIRALDKLRCVEPRRPGRLRDGVSLANLSGVATGKLYVLAASNDENSLSFRKFRAIFGNELPLSSPDNRILRVACELDVAGKNVVFVSKDINLRLKADTLGVWAMDFERQVNFAERDERMYDGFSEITVSKDKFDLLERKGVLAGLGRNFCPNEFVIVKSAGISDKTLLARHFRNDDIRLIEEVPPLWNISARNPAQRMALNLLFDPNIQLVTVVGSSGTGKTLLTLAAALSGVLSRKNYEKILISSSSYGNPTADIAEKSPNGVDLWRQPFLDCLNFVLGDDSKSTDDVDNYSVEDLINSKKINFETLNYIRGRSIARQFVIVEGAQNLTPQEAKTIIRRCGDGTKMVLLGDPAQIDNPYLDVYGNGLAYTVERMKNQPFFGHVTLAKRELSQLATSAVDLL